MPADRSTEIEKSICILLMPACPKSIAQSDQMNAASTPTLMSVSMVAARCRRLVNAARWNGQAPHVVTGVASPRQTHCQ
ncbi:unannotated protein [freshwater metagenome]|uniref:Unannotated protein n=1 Tax=freshwater metagenome TaxID=449393 RepID=A0A6J7EX23_9ZZZZ